MTEEEHKTEHKVEHKPKFKFNLPWVITAVIVILLAVSILTGGFGSVTGMWAANNPNGVGQNAISILNSNLNGSKATLVSTENSYFVTFKYSDKNYGMFVSGEGQMLTPPFEIKSSQTTQAPFDAPDTEKPTADLYVMSFCPYGQQAENSMISVVKLFGDKVTVRPRFIVSIQNDTVNSLHGDYEANEDMRQACIWKNYGSAKFWSYIEKFDGNCTKSNIDTCWKENAQAVGIDTTLIENCVKTEGLNLLKADEQLTTQNGISGSPTLIINGQLYEGQRTPEAFKSAICTGFTTQPDICSQNLSNSTTAASGNCG